MFKNKYNELRSGWALLLVLAAYFVVMIAVGVVIGLASVIHFFFSGGTDPNTIAQITSNTMSSPWINYVVYMPEVMP